MEVVKFKNEEGNTRYYVADDTGIPVEPILKFIRFKDNVRRQIVAKENIKILLIVLVNLQQINSSNARYSY